MTTRKTELEKDNMIPTLEQRTEMVDDIARKLRLTVEEFGENSIRDAGLVGFWDLGDEVCGLPYFYCPSVDNVLLCRVYWKVARFFEDIACDSKGQNEYTNGLR